MRKGLVGLYRGRLDVRKRRGQTRGWQDHRAFDDHLERSIDAGLFFGDERALPTLKAARAAYADYRQTYTPQGAGDEVGRVMQKIVGRYDGQAATPTEVANYLFGASGIGERGLSVKLAQRLGDRLGTDSPEWSAIRQGMWSKLTEPTEGRTNWGPQKVSERVAEFLYGNGKPLAQTLFSPEERSLMGRYAAILKQVVPPPGSVNYSNTAPVLAKLANGALSGITAMLGFHAAGPIGGLAGCAANAARQGLSDVGAANRTMRSFYGSPAQDAADARRIQQMVRAASIAARSSTALISDQSRR